QSLRLRLDRHSFPTRRSSDLLAQKQQEFQLELEKLRVTLGFQVQEQAISTSMKAKQQSDELAFKKEDREHEAAVQVQSGNEELRRDKERAAIQPKSDGDA